MKKTGLMIGAALAASLALPTAALADWPERPVRLIVPFGAGGGADTLGRAVAEQLSQTFGQQFVVENVTGAGGTVGVTALANSEPDNYTFGVINVSTHVIAPVTNPNVTYDPLEDFEYVAMLGGAPTVVAVNPSLEITTLEGLVEAARASDGPFPYGSPGTLTMSNLVPAIYFAEIGVEVEHIPYRGAAEAVVDAVAGHIPFTGTTLSTARAQLDEGTLIALAISTAERHPDFPDVPTFAELGHPNLTSLTWFGMAAPAGTDMEIVNRVSEEVNRILQSPALAERLANDGFVLDLMNPEEFRAYQVSQAEIFGPIAATLVE